MELRHLRYFVAVAEELHVGRAAARSFVAQPTLSQQIKAFEGEIGARLFDRSRRGVALTDVGAVLLPHARRVLGEAERAEAAVRAAAEGRAGGLRIGYIVLYTPTAENPEATRAVMRFVMGPGVFTALVVTVGVAMGIGKAAVYKFIPEYFPDDVGAVGGLVGMLGGFVLPLMFSAPYGATGLPQTTFLVSFVVTLTCLVWLHVVVMRILGEAAPHLEHAVERPPGTGRP